MDDSTTVEPFGFFTLESLGAGWYLTWRLLVRVAIGGVAAGAVAGLVHVLGRPEAALTLGRLGVAAATVWAVVLIPRITIQWAEQWYGATLTGRLRVGWGVVWRVCVIAFVVAVICTPPEFVALSLMTAFPGSALGLIGGLLSVTLLVVNAGAAVVAAGWAMSRVAVQQIESGVAEAPFPSEPDALAVAPAAPAVTTAPVVAVPLVVAAPVVAATPVAEAPPAAAPAMPAVPGAAAPRVTTDRPAAPTARAAPAAPARPAAAPDRPQCPKCGLYETERGTVIGWYCTVCGWREAKPR